LFNAVAARQLSRGIVEGVERLDRQLRAEEPVATVTQGIKQLQEQLQQLVDQAQPPEQ
jgi:phosphatidate phosphatase APP1